MAENTNVARAVCVFCGSSRGHGETYAVAAKALGAELARRGLDLIYGAGDIGLMGVLADSVLEAGGRVVGVIPNALVEREVAHRGLSELHVVETMHQRKALMADRSDAFLALPGGYGTLDELFEILTWAQLGIHKKPIGLVNVSGYFDPLLAWVELGVREGFLRARHRELLQVGEDAIELLERLLAGPAAPTVEKWVSPEER